MLPAVYRTLNTLPVQAFVGAGSDTRIFGSGMAPQNTVTPYITWFVVADQPYDQLSGAPCGDAGMVQIDCYTGPADNADRQVSDMAQAVRQALDDAGIANRVIVNQRDRDTKLFRIGLQADFITNR